ncbi:hypothetical protein ACWDKQ_34905 [Saccharopolyspora sp. NPDC000995]
MTSIAACSSGVISGEPLLQVGHHVDALVLADLGVNQVDGAIPVVADEHDVPPRRGGRRRCRRDATQHYQRRSTDRAESE